MQTNEKVVSVLNDLIKINNDRRSGYEKAANDTRTVDADLHTMFNGYVNDSEKYARELALEVKRMGGDAADGTTTRGKIYRAWVEAKSTFTGHDPKTILSACEYGEDKVQKAYSEALETDVVIDPNVRQLINSQKTALKKSHDLVKKYRDASVSPKKERATNS